jgi:hypothetical protein
MMRTRLLVVAVLAMALTGLIAAGAGAAQPGPSLNVTPNQILCFDGTTDGGFYGLCSITNRGVATLDNETNDATGADNPYDQYSGVYLKKSNLAGKAIGHVRQLGFSYTGTPTAGSPRISLPIDTNSDGTTDGYAFISAYTCNDGAGNVDAVADPTCTIYFGSDHYANLAALAAAHPEYRVTAHGIPFVIADDPGTWTVSNVKLGQILTGVGRG